MPERRGRVSEARAGLAAALANPGVRRLQLAWAGCATADLAQDVALAVHAFDVGGVGGVGVMGLVRSLPAAAVGPLAASAVGRFPRQRALLAALGGRTLVLAALAWTVAAGAPLAAVYVLAAVDSCVYTLYWPAQSALFPELAPPRSSPPPMPPPPWWRTSAASSARRWPERCSQCRAPGSSSWPARG